MIDTLKINTLLSTKVEPGDDWQKIITTSSKSTIRRDIYNHLGIRFTVTTVSSNAQWLSAEFSLPKIIFGHNVGIIDAGEVARGLEWLRTAILTLPLTAHLTTLEEWKVSRIDLAYAWRLGDPKQVIWDIHPTIRKRSSGKPIMFSGDSPDGMSLVIAEKSRRRIFYDKGAEVLSNQTLRDLTTKDRELLTDFATGVLRFESKSIRKRIHNTVFKGDMTVADLPAYIREDAEAELRKDLSGVCRSWRPNKASDVALALLEKFSLQRAMTLFGMYCAVESLGRDRYQKLTGANKEVLRRNIADLGRAGVGFGKVTRSVSLEIPSPHVVWCRDLDLKDVVASLAKEAA